MRGPGTPDRCFLRCQCYSRESLERLWFQCVGQKTSLGGKSRENLPLNLIGAGARASVGKGTGSGSLTDEWGQCEEPARPSGVVAAAGGHRSQSGRYSREPQRGQRGDAASP